MNELLKRIFTDIISREDDSFKTDKYIDQQIQEIINEHRHLINSDEEQEELRSLLYETALIAEQEGFVLGMKYLLKIALALLSDL